MFILSLSQWTPSPGHTHISLWGGHDYHWSRIISAHLLSNLSRAQYLQDVLLTNPIYLSFSLHTGSNNRGDVRSMPSMAGSWLACRRAVWTHGQRPAPDALTDRSRVTSPLTARGIKHGTKWHALLFVLGHVQCSSASPISRLDANQRRTITASGLLIPMTPIHSGVMEVPCAQEMAKVG